MFALKFLTLALKYAFYTASIRYLQSGEWMDQAVAIRSGKLVLSSKDELIAIV